MANPAKLYPAVCRRVDLHPAPTPAERREFDPTVESCVTCGAAVYVSRVIRERTTLWHCDRCVPLAVQSALREMGVPGLG